MVLSKNSDHGNIQVLFKGQAPDDDSEIDEEDEQDCDDDVEYPDDEEEEYDDVGEDDEDGNE